MILSVLALALAFQATPPPTPPPLTTPAPSPSASPLASPAASPLASPAAPASPPPLSATPQSLELQPGGSQSVSIPNATAPLNATVDVPVVTVTVDQAARTLTVTATQQTGRAIVTVTDASGASVQIPVRVALPAATLPAPVALRVTGNPVDQAWLQKQVQQAVTKAVQLQQGVAPASVQIGAYSLPPSLAPGASTAVPIAIRVAGGEQFLDVNASLSVNIQNVALDPFAPPLLFYDDDPEKIPANGVLYRGQVNPGTPARLYYYHQNTGEPRRLLVLLTTASAQPATVQLIDASAGPNIDVMSVGHAVSRDFLSAKPRGEGVVVDVAPGTPFIVDDFSVMKPLDGVAGSIGMRITNGGPLTVTVLAVPPSAAASDVAAMLGGPQLPGDGHRRTGVFNIRAFGTQTVPYTVGGADAPVQYGASTPPAQDPASGHDYGEYGVLRTLTFDIQNPGADPTTVYLYERPLGGVVRSSFLVNGSLAQVGCARVSDRYQVGTPFTVNPGRALINVQTMTDGGSNYPLEVGLTTTPPQIATPPITAPNGCFPKAVATPAPEPTGR